MGDGAGAGYNIPISVSYARTETTNPILDAGTTFNFSSPWATGGSNDQTSRLVSSATATSSAAEGGPATSGTSAPLTVGTDTTPAPAATTGLPTWAWVAIVAGGLLAVGAIYYIAKKSR